MNFRPELAAAVMAGRKTVTRRLVSDNPRSPWFKDRCALQVGHDYAICPGRGKNAIGRVRILSVSQRRLGDDFGAFGQVSGSLVEARREGFPTPVSFQLAWLKINGTYEADALVWRIEFGVAS